MAIHKQSYRSYSGPITNERWRFLVLTRYSWRGIFQSRLLTAFFVLCFFYPVGALIALYLNSSASLLTSLHLQAPPFEVSGRFFLLLLTVQGLLAFLLTSFVGPGLVAPDLSNGGLPLYFCRPFSKAEYVLGKMAVLFGLLSFITWLPGLVLFAVESSLAGPGWMMGSLWLARGVILGSLIWILILSLMALALSAWVKWRIAAAALMLAIFFLGAGLAQAINVIFRTRHGALTAIGELIAVVWSQLFRVVDDSIRIPPAEAWIALIVICLCCLGLLSRKLRAHEVVR